MYPDKWVKLLQLNLEYFKIATNNIKKKNKKLKKKQQKKCERVCDLGRLS